jgi:hypothetical protein
MWSPNSKSDALIELLTIASILSLHELWGFFLCFQLNFWPFQSIRVEVSNSMCLVQFIFNSLIELLTIYFEGPKFMELWGYFFYKIVLPIELLTFHALKLQVSELLSTLTHFLWLNWTSNHLFWRSKVHRALGVFLIIFCASNWTFDHFNQLWLKEIIWVNYINILGWKRTNWTLVASREVLSKLHKNHQN